MSSAPILPTIQLAVNRINGGRSGGFLGQREQANRAFSGDCTAPPAAAQPQMYDDLPNRP